MVGGPWKHIDLWRHPNGRQWYDHLEGTRTLVRYNVRGTELSQRDVDDYSLESRVADVKAVVDCLGVDRFDLFGAMGAGPEAIGYAAKHPECVDGLVL